MRARVSRLEGDQRERLAVWGTLFTYTDAEGRERERVVVMQTGETLDLDVFRATYPDGEVCEFRYAGVDPDWL